MMLRPRPRSSTSIPLDDGDDDWPASLSFPLLDRTMTSNSDVSSAVSSSSTEANTTSVGMVESAARYFNNLRIASSDDEEEAPGTLTRAIFRVPSSNDTTNNSNNFIRNNSSSSSSRLPIPFRPSREFDDDINNNTTTMTRPTSPFDPYGDDSLSTGTTTSSDRSASVPFFPLFLDDDEAPISFPSLPSFSTESTSSATANTATSALEGPPLQVLPPLLSAANSSSIIINSSNLLYSPRTPPPQAPTNCNECYPPNMRAHLPKPTRKSTQGILAVQGAGIPSVNGAYKRTGRFDRVAMYTKRSFHHGRPVTFTIFRCVASDFSRKWYLSIVSSSARTGVSMPCTSHDVDLYTAPSIGGGSAEELPPENGWRPVSGSGWEGTQKNPHCLWIPMHNKEAGSSSTICNGCNRNTRGKPSSVSAVARQQEKTTTRKVVQCCVCMARKVSHVFFPCGHAAICGDCSKQWRANLRNGKRRDCPIGRCKVKGIIRLYGTIVEDD